MPGIGVPELIIVLVILLVIFGPKRLPGLGKSLGSGMREFKDSITGRSDEEDKRSEQAKLEVQAAAPQAGAAAGAGEVATENKA